MYMYMRSSVSVHRSQAAAPHFMQLDFKMLGFTFECFIYIFQD